MKKFIIKLVLLCLIVISSPFIEISYAQESDSDFSVGDCVSQGNFEFVLFLETLIYSDGWFDGIIEPFNDVIFRNQCQLSKINSLINQRDSVRSLIRDAFLMCRNEKVPALKIAYHKVNAEIYYLRNVVITDIKLSIIPNYFLMEELEKTNSIFYTPRSQLYSEMKEKYVNDDILNKEQFDIFFDSLEIKYKNEKKKFIVCESNEWEKVAEKWDEFWESGAGTIPAAKSFATGVTGSYKSLENSIDFPDFTVKGIFNSLAIVTVNGLPPEQGLEDILKTFNTSLTNLGIDFSSEDSDNPYCKECDDIKEQCDENSNFNIKCDYCAKNCSFLAKQSMTKGSLIMQSNEGAIIQSIDEIKSEMKNNIKNLYYSSSDKSIFTFLNEQDKLIDTLESSIIPMNKVLDCTKTINNRQCPNK